MTERQWDTKLKIQTIGREDAHEDVHHYPYEPTPYMVLERLADSGYLTGRSVLVDYGCGKGRVGFFLHHRIGCKVIGVEYEESVYRVARRNLESYSHKSGVAFVHASAESFSLEEGDHFYFFNPFSVEILKSVLGRIQESYYANPRPMQLYFYYPNEEYVAYLMTVPSLLFVDEIDCQDLFEGNNPRERILIFEVC